MIATLTGDSTLTALVPASNIFVGPVDIAFEKQDDLLYPSIVLSQISEVVRTVPLYARDTQVQIDLYTRNSQLELENIYERVLQLLDYQSGNQSTAHVFWQRLGGAVDVFETDRRFWRRTCTFVVWSIKP